MGCKIAFKDRFYDVEQGPLHNSISQSGYSKWALFFTPRLGYPNPFDCLRLVLIGSQFLLQLRYRLVFAYFNLSCALMVDSGASAFSHYLLQRSGKILWTPDFIDQPKPFSSFNPRFQGCQHAFGPDHGFHPRPAGADLSLLWSRCRHSRGSLFLWSVCHASTFLPPLTPRALTRFFATTEALSPPGHSSSGLSTMNAVPFPVRDP